MREKRNRSGKNNAAKIYLTAFFVPVFIVTAIYLFSDIYPLGNQCFMKTDMYHQYIPFMSEFRHKLLTGESLLYCFDVGLGVNFLAVYAYYLASPLNWLIVLAGENSVIEFMTGMTIFKIGLCGAAFTFWLRYHTKDRRDMGAALFGIAYALSGYMCAYYWNTMWLDCIILFPLIVGALERLIREGRTAPYALLLGLCITSNYYISIMVCIFLVLYFIAQNVLLFPRNLKTFLLRCLRFTAGSLTAGAMAAALLLPAYFALKMSASASSTFPSTVKSYFSVVEMLARLQPCVTTEQVLAHWPNIYCGTFVFLLFPLYLSAKRISAREKAVFVTLSLLMLASFSINVLDYLWHGMHFPNSLPCRQSFAFVLLLLYMSFRAYERKEYFSFSQVGGSLLIAAAFILLMQKDADTKYYEFYVTWAALALCGLYALVLLFYRNGKLSRVTAFFAALLLVAAEVTANAAVTGFTTCSRTYYTADNEDVKKLVSEVYEDGELIRFDRGTRKTKNDGAWLHFPTLSLFSSTANADLSKLMTKFGCEASTNAYSIVGATPFVDMLFGIRYYISSTDLSASGEKTVSGRTLINESGDTWLYENDSVLPFGFVLTSKAAEGNITGFDNPATMQNNLCDYLGVPHVLKEEPNLASGSGKTKTVYTSERGFYYAYITNTSVKSVSVSVDGESKTFDNTDRKYLLELGELDQDTCLKFTSKTDGQDMSVKLYRFNYEALKEAEEKLSEGSFKVTSSTGDSFAGTVTVDPAANGYKGENAVLCFPVPYDEGWHATVDGKEVTPEKGFGDALLCLTLTEGTHTVSMQYEPKGFTAGIFISLAGYLSLLLLFLSDRTLRKKGKREGKEGRRRKIRGMISEDRFHEGEIRPMFEERKAEKTVTERLPEKETDSPGTAPAEPEDKEEKE